MAGAYFMGSIFRSEAAGPGRRPRRALRCCHLVATGGSGSEASKPRKRLGRRHPANHQSGRWLFLAGSLLLCHFHHGNRLSRPKKSRDVLCKSCSRANFSCISWNLGSWEGGGMRGSQEVGQLLRT